MLGCMSAPASSNSPAVGRLDMSGSKRGAFDFHEETARRQSPSGHPARRATGRCCGRIPKILRFIPGRRRTCAPFPDAANIGSPPPTRTSPTVRFLVNPLCGRRARQLRGTLRAGRRPNTRCRRLSSASARTPVSSSAKALPAAAVDSRGVVGLLLMRSYHSANNTAHYDAVIAALEGQGPARHSAFDQRPRRAGPRRERSSSNAAGRPCIDAFVSLTGFRWSAAPPTTTAAPPSDLLGELRRSLCRRARAGVPDARHNGNAPRKRPAAIEKHHHGRHSRTRGASGPDGVWRPDRRRHARSDRPNPSASARSPNRQPAGAVCARRARGARLAIVLFNFSANGGAAGHRRLLGVYASRIAQHAAARCARRLLRSRFPANEGHFAQRASSKATPPSFRRAAMCARASPSTTCSPRAAPP